MECNGKITFLINDDGATLELVDSASSIHFIRIKLDKDQTLRVLSREGYVNCDMLIAGFDKVGKKMVVDELIFEMPECDYKKEKSVAYEEAVRLCPAGWEVDGYFGSKNNFFWDKDGVRHARATIRKWISQSEIDEWNESCNQN